MHTYIYICVYYYLDILYNQLILYILHKYDQSHELHLKFCFTTFEWFN